MRGVGPWLSVNGCRTYPQREPGLRAKQLQNRVQPQKENVETDDSTTRVIGLHLQRLTGACVEPTL